VHSPAKLVQVMSVLCYAIGLLWTWFKKRVWRGKYWRRSKWIKEKSPKSRWTKSSQSHPSPKRSSNINRKKVRARRGTKARNEVRLRMSWDQIKTCKFATFSFIVNSTLLSVSSTSTSKWSLVQTFSIKGGAFWRERCTLAITLNLVYAFSFTSIWYIGIIDVIIIV
jgi:hypothetical protein